MKSNNTRRRFLKQASTIAIVSSTIPKRIHDFFVEPGPSGYAAGDLLQPIAFSYIRMQGELMTRAMRNYDRLEDDIYKPQNDFNPGGASEGWPGDKEGRIILGLTLQAQATHREPKYLTEIITLIAEHVNEKGYLGPVMKDKIMEQQLSGHGWLLRGLCEYYGWRKDPMVKKYITDIVDNLALPTRGNYKAYPIDVDSRKLDVGAAAGTTQSTVGKWMLSSDIGCAFIFLDGVVQAYSIYPSSELKGLIEEMIDRFFQIDLVAIKAQAHATLTALRGVIRYYVLTGNLTLLREAEERYILYRTVDMTENYENYNWFGRPEWTESCAIIDSFMVAVQLWQYTGNPLYLEDAHHIYYNAICHAQRANGGFGLDNCPGPVADALNVFADEAYWCCTMRGGEGLASAISYNYFPGPKDLTIPFYNSSEATFEFWNRKVTIRQVSGYPFENKVVFNITDSEASPDILLKLFAPAWMINLRITVNGEPITFKRENGFISFNTILRRGTRIDFDFDQQVNTHHVVNMEHSRASHYAISYGPLILGYEGDKQIAFNKDPQVIRQADKQWKVGGLNNHFSPVYHLMDPHVSKESGYQKQILFRYG